MKRKYSDLLLRGIQPVILCSAKGLNRLRLGKPARAALKEDRLLALSPFDQTIRRTTAARAIIRNNLVAAMSVAMLIPPPHPVEKPGRQPGNSLKQSIQYSHLTMRPMPVSTIWEPKRTLLIVPVT
jgi:hypothetical protein